jgi:hypothetical protein
MSVMVNALAKSKYFGKGVKVSSHTTDVEAAILGAQLISVLQRAGMKPFDRRMTYTTVGAVGVGLLVSTSTGEYDLVDDIIAAAPKFLIGCERRAARGVPHDPRTGRGRRANGRIDIRGREAITTITVRRDRYCAFMFAHDRAGVDLLGRPLALLSGES